VTVAVEGGHLNGLATLRINDLQSVAGTQEHRGDRSAGYSVALDSGLEVGHARHEEAGALRHRDRHVPFPFAPPPRLGFDPCGPYPDLDNKNSV